MNFSCPALLIFDNKNSFFFISFFRADVATLIVNELRLVKTLTTDSTFYDLKINPIQSIQLDGLLNNLTRF
jgi:hypothetical protein